MLANRAFAPDIRVQKAYLRQFGIEGPPSRNAIKKLVAFLKRGSVLVPRLSEQERAQLYLNMSQEWDGKRIQRRHARTIMDRGVVKYLLVRSDTERYSHTAFARGTKEEKLFDVFIEWDGGATGKMNMSLIERIEEK